MTSINAIQSIRIEEYDIRRLYIHAVVPELDPRIYQDLKGLILFRPAGKICHTEFDGIENQVLVTGPQTCPETMIQGRLAKVGLVGGGQ